MKHKVLLLIIAIALCTPLKAQYEGLIIKMDFFDPTTPKEKRSIEVFEDVFTSRFVLTVSTTKTIYNRSSESVYEGVRKTTNHLRSKTTTEHYYQSFQRIFQRDCWRVLRCCINMLDAKDENFFL